MSTATSTDSRVRGRLIGVLVLVLLISVPWGVQMGIQLRRQLYVPTEDIVIDKIFEMVKLTKDDVLFDLGCGDGRIVVQGAKKIGCKGVGVEFNQKRVEESVEVMREAGVTKEQVDIRFGDAMKVPDLKRATVVVMYLLPQIVAEMEPILQKELKPGTRVVSVDYSFPTLEPDEVIEVPVPNDKGKRLLLYRMREQKK